MNYYEELGVNETATVDEIRHAYRAMARLLHPDNQSDLALRAAAERQMARLNGIVSVLTDTDQRRHYDERLHANSTSALASNGNSVKPHRVWTPAPEPPYIPQRRFQLLQFAAQNWSWILTGLVIAAASITFVLTGNRPTVVRDWNTAVESSLSTRTADPDHSSHKHPVITPEPSASRLPEAGLPVQPGPLASPQETLKAPDLPVEHSRNNSANTTSISAGRSTSPNAPAVDSAAASSPAGAIPPAVAAMPPSASTPVPAATGSQSPSPTVAVSRAEEAHPSSTDDPFSGRWFFAANTSMSGPFPTDSIELRLRNDNGSLRGEYRAVYRVPDRSISPEVSFDLEGRLPPGRIARLDWSSSDSGHGLMDIVMRASGELDVTWWTTQFGKRATLRSGKAILTKERSR